MTPEQAIAMLERQLTSHHSHQVTVRRGPKGAPDAMIANIPAFVRGYNATDAVAGSGISQQDSKVIFSPASLEAWPGDLPKEGDWCEIDGQFRAILTATAVKIQGVAVRIELQVKG